MLVIIQQEQDLNTSDNIYGIICRAIFMFCIVMVLSCNVNSNKREPIVGDTLELRHSSLLSIIECDDYTVADIGNPWGKGILHRYVLVDKESDLSETLPDGTLLRVPLDSILLFSTVHAELVCTFGCSDAVKGVCESSYITQQPLVAALRRGEIIDCGSSLNVDLERVAQLSPQAVWVLPYENGGYGKLDKLSYPLVECAEYMENSPLGAAEWMRFYGRLLGKAVFADSLFNIVEKNYLALKENVLNITGKRPTLMCELKTSSAWYVPGGCSTMGLLYKDAGADYIFSSYRESGSLPLSYETLLSKASEADFWLIKHGGADKSYSSLKSEFEGYTHFKPYRERNVYVCNLSRKRFYEETPFRPDLLLRELVAIFHPEIVWDKKLRYYEKMGE